MLGMIFASIETEPSWRAGIYQRRLPLLVFLRQPDNFLNSGSEEKKQHEQGNSNDYDVVRSERDLIHGSQGQEIGTHAAKVHDRVYQDGNDSDLRGSQHA